MIIIHLHAESHWIVQNDHIIVEVPHLHDVHIDNNATGKIVPKAHHAVDIVNVLQKIDKIGPHQSR